MTEYLYLVEPYEHCEMCHDDAAASGQALPMTFVVYVAAQTAFINAWRLPRDLSASQLTELP